MHTIYLFTVFIVFLELTFFWGGLFDSLPQNVKRRKTVSYSPLLIY